MHPDTARQHISNWFDSLLPDDDMHLLQVAENDPRAVVTEDGLVKSSYGFRNCRDIIAGAATTDFNDPERPLAVEGVIYMVYTRHHADNSIKAKYIGMASIHGKTERGISTLFRNREIRFDHRPRSNGHLGNLNEALVNIEHSYANWVNAFFLTEEGVPRLREPVYVKMTLWDKHSVSIVPNLEHMSLEAEEMIRIDLLRQANMASGLLNKTANH